MPTASQVLRFLPNDERMIRKVHALQQTRIQRRLAMERKQVSRWNSGGFHATVMPDGTQVQFRIPRFSYMYWARRLGDECWQDAGFIREFLRDNPECRVNSKSTRLLSGWTPGSRYASAYRMMRAPARIGAGPEGTGEANSKKFDRYALNLGDLKPSADQESKIVLTANGHE